jgi:hypothetical protein
LTTGSGYQWLNCQNDYQKIEGATDPIFIPLVSGSYALEVTNECIDTSVCQEVIISGIFPIKPERNRFIIAPNPISNSFTLQSDHPTSIEFIRIFNVQGQPVLKLNEIQGGKIIPVNLFPGLYTILIGSRDHTMETHKIIIR